MQISPCKRPKCGFLSDLNKSKHGRLRNCNYSCFWCSWLISSWISSSTLLSFWFNIAAEAYRYGHLGCGYGEKGSCSRNCLQSISRSEFFPPDLLIVFSEFDFCPLIHGFVVSFSWASQEKLGMEILILLAHLNWRILVYFSGVWNEVLVTTM